ncbi:IclR family transcriptional regulator [Alloalcanivorax xenomutans]|uniref:IclR family transcriptional regulator n=1 Tax=Alloalcanivorax xenomutans TaxID=1094342 RepID=UPI0035A83EAC
MTSPKDERSDSSSRNGGGRNGSTKDVGAVVNAIQLLRHLAHQQAPEGVAAIARATGVSPSSAFNILRTLNNEGFVRFDESSKTYQLGIGLSELTVNLIGQSYADLIQPELERLALNLDILIVLWRITHDNHVSVIARGIPNVAHVDVRLDSRLPELIGACGRAIAGVRDLPDAELRRRFARLRWENPPSFEEYQKGVKEAREQGWALDDNCLYRGISMVASVLTDHHNQPRFAISGIGITAQHNARGLARAGEAIRDTAHFLERSLFPRNLRKNTIDE